MALTPFEQAYGEMSGLSREEITQRIVASALDVFDEMDSAPEFGDLTMAAQKDFEELMAYCRALRKLP